MSFRRKLTSLFFHLPYRRLWVQIIPVFLLAVALPVVLLGVSLLKTSERAMRDEVLASHKEIAVMAARGITLFMEGAQGVMRSTSTILDVVYPSPWRQETVLVELVLDQSTFIRAVSVDTDGRPWASSELGRPLPQPTRKDILDTALREGVYLSDVEMLDDRTPYMTLVTPIKKMGKAVGYLIGDVNLRGVWDVVDGIRLGKTGHALLVSRDGRLIAHRDKKRVLKKEDLSSEKDVQAVLAGQTAGAQIEDAAGKRLITSYAPVPDTGWGLVLRQDREEAYLFSKIMKRQFLLIVMGGGLLAIAASVFIAHFLTRPIKTLGSKIRAVADGDLDQNLVVRRRDEMGELVRSFNRMTVKLREAREKTRLSVVGEAASWISHELKNSLMMLKLFAHSFSTEHADAGFIDKFDRLLPSEISRWERLLSEFSGLSSCDALKVGRVHVCNLLDETLEMLSKKLKEGGIDVKRLCPEGGLCVMGDQERLKQVFINIVLNAIDAMPQGGELTVEGESVAGPAAPQPGSVEVRIKDTGRGISDEMLDKIFNPLYTTRRGHSGLGLSICRRIVEQHGGSIGAKSTPGVGTTFIIRLPAGAALGITT